MTNRSLFVLSIGMLGVVHCSSKAEVSAPANAGGSAGSATMEGGAGTGGSSAGAGGSAAGAAGAAAGSAGASGAGGSTMCDGSAVAYADAQKWIDAYEAAHPGNGGKDWDINAKTDAEIAADPDLQRLICSCGDDQRPVIPLLAWEYGGNDHPWISPGASALVYCVYTPVHPSTAHWQYDPGKDHVTADLYVKFPDQNPCKNETGANQVMSCLGDPTNIEILVDTASLKDGAGAGLMLANATTDLYLILPDSTRVLIYQGQ